MFLIVVLFLPADVNLFDGAGSWNRAPRQLGTTTEHQRAECAQQFEPLLTAEDAASLLGGLHVKTVQKMARHGQLPSYHVGKFWFFRASELNVWLARLQSDCQSVRVH